MKFIFQENVVVFHQTMTCSSEPLIVTYGMVTSVSPTTCVSIPETIVGFRDGSTSSYVFLEVADTIENVDFSNAFGLLRIGAYTFYKCKKLTKLNLSSCKCLNYLGIGAFRESSVSEVIFPESPLTYLPGGCFCNCKNLQYFEIPSNIVKINNDSPTHAGVFAYCSKLKNVTFRENSKCTTIGSKAFYYSSLQSFFIPKLVTSISGFSFRVCEQLKEVIVDKENDAIKSNNGILFSNDSSLLYYPNKATDGSVAIVPDGTTRIRGNAFVGTTSYTSITIPSSVKTIDSTAFYYVNSLETIVIPSSVDSIGTSLLMNSFKLTNVTFENCIESIPASCFQYCRSLKEFYVPSGVKNISKQAFASCSSLLKLYVPKSVQTFESGVFQGCSSNLELIFEKGSGISFFNYFLYNKDMTKIISYLGDNSSIVINSSVNTIGYGAFQGKGIQKIEYENISNITTIEDYAFYGCSSLKEIEIPSMYMISSYTFYQCQNLKNITIPSRVEIIGEYSFSGCTQLEEIVMNARLSKVDKYAFYNCTALSKCVLPDSVNEIGESGFSCCSSLNSFYLPSNLNKIGENAFASSGISSFTNTEKTSIANLTRMSFYKCNNLQYFKVAESVETIRENAISSCENLETIEFGKYLSSIDNYAISNCPKLANIIIGNNSYLTSFSSLAFNDCSSLTSIDTNGDNHFFFEDCILYNKEQTEIIVFLRAKYPRTIVIPSTVKTVSNFAFSDCPTLNNVTFLGEGIERIEISAFMNCVKLMYVNFPSSLKFIGTNAFKNCNLRAVNLQGSNVTSLYEGCFMNNKRLTLIILPTVLEECSTTAFVGTNKGAVVFYHGSNVIQNSAGFTGNVQMICFDNYKSDRFLSLLVQHSLKRICTLKSRHERVISGCTMILLAAFCY